MKFQNSRYVKDFRKNTNENSVDKTFGHGLSELTWATLRNMGK